MNALSKEDTLIIEKAVSLSLIEILLGTFLHAFRTPFAGHFLSLNQGAFLCHYVRSCTNRLKAAKNTFTLSTIVAMMKTLSLSGRKLGPMLGIFMQGLLYSLGIVLGGIGVGGQILAMTLLSLWAIAWPLITYFFIFGTDLASAFFYFGEKMQEYLGVDQNTLIMAISLLIIIKLTIGIVITFYLQKERRFECYESFLQKITIPVQKKPSFLKNIPIGLLLSFIVMGFFFYLNETQTFSQKMLQAIVMAILFFSLTQSSWPIKFLSKTFPSNKSIQKISLLSKKALQRLQKKLAH